MRILVVEDDPVLADGLKVGLHLQGAAVDAFGTCADARAALDTTRFEAVVLDLMLPDGSGLDLLADIRRSGVLTPIILLTALGKVADRIAGLDAGADDYMGKPFDLEELAARIRVAIRRSNGRAEPCIKVGDIVLDPATQRVSVGRSNVELSRREFTLLSALMERSGAILSRSEIEDHLYGWQEEVESNTVEVYVHKLRSKLGKNAIETVRGLGYRIRTSR